MNTGSFSSWDHHKEWANEQSPLAVSLVRTRAALRAIPAITGVDLDTLGHTFLEAARFALSGIACCRSQRRVRPLEVPLGTELSFLDEAVDMEQRTAMFLSLGRFPGTYGAFVAPRTGETTSSVFEDDVDELARVALSEDIYNLNVLTEDIKEGSSFSGFFEPLWGYREPPEPVVRRIADLRQLWRSNQPTWQFWQRWYESYLKGAPLHWDLQEAVALISDEVWDAGPELVAERIREIEARFAVKWGIDEAESALSEISRARLGIGGNNPPEPIEGAPNIATELVVIWEPLEELARETRSEQPEKSVIQRSIDRLIGSLIAYGKWTGEKVDAAATEYAKSIGKWGGGLTTVWLATLHPKIATVIEAARTWLSMLL